MIIAARWSTLAFNIIFDGQAAVWTSLRLLSQTRAATGAETSSLAAKRHQMLMAAAVALDAKEAMFKPPALQVLIKFFCDVSR